MSKLRRDLSVTLAGASCGLFGVSVFLLAARVDSYHAYLRWLRETSYAAPYDWGVDTLRWVPLAVWHAILSITAALLMHRYLPTNRVSPFLRWQVIGLVALVGWVLTVFTCFGMDWLIHASLNSVEMTFERIRFISVAQFVASVFAANVLYGSAVQAAATQHMCEDHQVSGSEV